MPDVWAHEEDTVNSCDPEYGGIEKLASEDGAIPDRHGRQTSTEALTDSHLRLLLKINEYGSLSRSAKDLGLSYKDAWDMIIAINRLAGRQLVYRMSAGMMQGGVTRLTEEGGRVIADAIVKGAGP